MDLHMCSDPAQKPESCWQTYTRPWPGTAGHVGRATLNTALKLKGRVRLAASSVYCNMFVRIKSHIQWATRNPRFPFTLCVAAPSMQSSRPAAYNGKWPERAIIDHMYNAALYSEGLRRWCCRPTFTSRPLPRIWMGAKTTIQV